MWGGRLVHIPDCPGKYLPSPRDVAAPGRRLHPRAQEGESQLASRSPSAGAGRQHRSHAGPGQSASSVSQEIAIGFSISRRASGGFPHIAEAR